MPSRATGLVLGLLILLLAPVLLAWRGLLEPVLAVPLALGALAVLAWVQRSRRPASEDSDDGGTVWELIPSRQYDGRHVESGGLARGEQERALRDVAEEADELEAGHRGQ